MNSNKNQNQNFSADQEDVTTRRITARQEDIYHNGYDAFFAGLRIGDNPLKEDETTDAQYWIEGWSDAERDNCEYGRGCDDSYDDYIDHLIDEQKENR